MEVVEMIEGCEMFIKVVVIIILEGNGVCC